jgi:hypothetical protein
MIHLLLLLLLSGCAVAPWTISPLTFSSQVPYGAVPPGYVPVSPHVAPPPPDPMKSHVRLPSCGQCHK